MAEAALPGPLPGVGAGLSRLDSGLAVDLAALDAALLTAHAAGDAAALSRLYAEASEAAETAGERDRAAFYLTHAYVFALDRGEAAAALYRARLQAWGRED
jgi:hypothetical protein